MKIDDKQNDLEEAPQLSLEDWTWKKINEQFLNKIVKKERKGKIRIGNDCFLGTESSIKHLYRVVMIKIDDSTGEATTKKGAKNQNNGNFFKDFYLFTSSKLLRLKRKNQNLSQSLSHFPIPPC